METTTTDWKKEMERLLAIFSRETKQSLGHIKMALKRSGLPFNATFRQYFVEVSINRIKETYDQFDMESMFEEQVKQTAVEAQVDASVGRLVLDSVIQQPQTNEKPKRKIQLIEIDDSSDEETVHVKTESLAGATGERGAIATRDRAGQFNNVVEIDSSDGDSDDEAVVGSIKTPPTHRRTNGNAVTSNCTGANENGNGLIVVANLETNNGHHVNDDAVERAASQNDSSNVDGITIGRACDRFTRNKTQIVPKRSEKTFGSGHAKLTNANDDEYGLNDMSEGATARQSKNGEEPVVKEEGDTKPKVKEMDDDIPLVLVEAKRKVNVSSVEQAVNYNAHDPGKAVDNLASIDMPSSSNTLNNVVGTNGKRSALTQSKTKQRLRCTVCGFVGIHSSHLNRHMCKHKGERPYRCDRCGKGFTTLQHLKKHATTHTDIYPFHCKGCFRQFLHKTEKEAHEKECTARRYECHLCKKFVTHIKSLLKMHMRKHTGEKPFRCEICMARFTLKCNLKSHLNNVHGKTH